MSSTFGSLMNVAAPSRIKTYTFTSLMDFSHHAVGILKREVKLRAAISPKINSPIDLAARQNEGSNDRDDRHQTRPPPLHTANHSAPLTTTNKTATYDILKRSACTPGRTPIQARRK